MPEKTAIREGQIVWADASARNVPEAASFYQHVFGWEYQVAPSELGYYHTALDAGRKAAGIGVVSSPDVAPVWTVSLAVKDARGAVARANELGGATVMEAMELPQQAMLAIAATPGGARFGMWQSFNNHGFEARGEHGAFAWCQAFVADVPGTVAFLRGLFGFEERSDSGGGARVLMLGGEPVMGVSARNEFHSADELLPYFQVHDTDAAVAAVQAGGGTVLYGPADTRDGRVAVFSDEGGARFGVVRP